MIGYSQLPDQHQFNVRPKTLVDRMDDIAVLLVETKTGTKRLTFTHEDAATLAVFLAHVLQEKK
jgi:hypothetical protein